MICKQTITRGRILICKHITCIKCKQTITGCMYHERIMGVYSNKQLLDICSIYKQTITGRM